MGLQQAMQTQSTKQGTRIRVAIIDDEPLGRQKIRRLLRGEDDFEVVGEYDGEEPTIRELRRLGPDLIFLDIQMPTEDGFALLRRLDPDSMPRVIFVTAYDQYALRAFEIHASDYLLKPFDRDRFQQALARVKESIQGDRSKSVDRRLIELLEDLKTEKKFPDRIAVKSGGYVHFVRTSDLNYIEAAGNYVRLHVSAKSYLLRETMNDIQSKLNPKQFVRIHRSTLVNVDSVKELQPWFGGSSVVILNDGTRLNMSRAFRSDLSSTILGNNGAAKSDSDVED
jgi:two-component system, LytTR family, response regulator